MLNKHINTYFTQKLIPDLFHDAETNLLLYYYSKTEGCCIYGLLIYISWLVSLFLPESILYLTHDPPQKFMMSFRDGKIPRFPRYIGKKS